MKKRLYKSDQLVDRSGRLSPKMDPIFLCRLHWRKSGCLSENYIGVFAYMLEVDLCRGQSLSIERYGWGCSVIRDSVASALSKIDEIRPDSSIYAEKDLWGWYDMQAPGDGKKLCCFHKVSYLWSGSD